MAGEKKVFDLDAFNNEEGIRVKGHYVAAVPSGVLSMHIKQVKKLDASHVTSPDPDVYVRIRVGKLIKCTQTVTIDKGCTIVDDIRHFSINVSRKRDDPSNEIRIDLILVESPRVHRIIGHKDMHIYEIIKNLYIAGTYELQYRHHTIGEIELEGCFTYGLFGFGYSHQLENRQKKLSDILGHSLLLRVEPPENRRQANTDVMAPMPVDHPKFINFTEKVQIGRTSKDLGNTSSALDVFAGMEKHEPVILARTMRKRLNRIQTDFAQQSSRLQRKRFLEKLIWQHVEHHEPDAEANDQQMGFDDIAGTSLQSSAPNGSEPPTGKTSSLLNIATDTYGDDDDYAASMSDVTEIGNFLKNAPGIVTTPARIRGRPARMMPSESSFEDETYDADTSASESHTSSRLSETVTAAAENQYRRRSTLVELPQTIARGFAGRLRAWRTSLAQHGHVESQTATNIRESAETRTDSTTTEQATPTMTAFRRRMHGTDKRQESSD